MRFQLDGHLFPHASRGLGELYGKPFFFMTLYLFHTSYPREARSSGCFGFHQLSISPIQVDTCLEARILRVMTSRPLYARSGHDVALSTFPYPEIRPAVSVSMSCRRRLIRVRLVLCTQVVCVTTTCLGGRKLIRRPIVNLSLLPSHWNMDIYWTLHCIGSTIHFMTSYPYHTLSAGGTVDWSLRLPSFLD